MAQTNIEKFESMLSRYDREGMDRLLDYSRFGSNLRFGKGRISYG